jgi:hypothetical protein
MRHRHPGTLWPTTHDEPRAARAAPGYGASAGDLSVKCLSVSCRQSVDTATLTSGLVHCEI